MNMFRKMNVYFFGNEYVHIKDFLWFYGVLGLAGLAAVYMAVSSSIQLNILS